MTSDSSTRLLHRSLAVGLALAAGCSSSHPPVPRPAISCIGGTSALEYYIAQTSESSPACVFVTLVPGDSPRWPDLQRPAGVRASNIARYGQPCDEISFRGLLPIVFATPERISGAITGSFESGFDIAFEADFGPANDGSFEAAHETMNVAGATFTASCP